mmetsp:Transcript_69561/g.220224  ORF Transcript_69561/g.220224 Transcript_69561/m.220224 type:complete len:275 (-) Transcript_69561:878-1702(-)
MTLPHSLDPREPSSSSPSPKSMLILLRSPFRELFFEPSEMMLPRAPRAERERLSPPGGVARWSWSGRPCASAAGRGESTPLRRSCLSMRPRETLRLEASNDSTELLNSSTSSASAPLAYAASITLSSSSSSHWTPAPWEERSLRRAASRSRWRRVRYWCSRGCTHVTTPVTLLEKNAFPCGSHRSSQLAGRGAESAPSATHSRSSSPWRIPRCAANRRTSASGKFHSRISPSPRRTALSSCIPTPMDAGGWLRATSAPVPAASAALGVSFARGS